MERYEENKTLTCSTKSEKGHETSVSGKSKNLFLSFCSRLVFTASNTYDTHITDNYMIYFRNVLKSS